MKHFYDAVQNQVGGAISGATVAVNVSGGGLATIYSDDGVTPKGNPTTTDSLGRFDFYVADGRYDIQVSGTGLTTLTQSNVEIADVTEAQNPDLPLAVMVAQIGPPPVASTGTIRLPKGGIIAARNSGNTADINIATNIDPGGNGTVWFGPNNEMLADGSPTFRCNGIDRFSVLNVSPFNTLQGRSDGVFGWSSSTNVKAIAADTALSRESPAVVDVGNGTQGDSSGTIKARTAAITGATSGLTAIVAAATASGTLTVPSATDTLVGKATTDTLTNKTLDTAGAGNFLKINGTQVSAVTGTGSVVLATSPTLTTPAIASITNAGTITVPTGTDTLVARATTDTLSNKTLTGASSGNAVTLLNWQGIQAAVTGDSTDKTYYTYTLPANTLGAGKGIRITVLLYHTTGAATPTFRLSFGGTLTTAFGNASVGTTTNGIGYTYIVMNNPGVTNAQTISTSGGSASTYNHAVNTAAVSTTSGVVINTTFNVANTDQITPQMFLVELIQ